ncbi:MAG TPA: T9SS type A sorting domain-containing protein, partial [Flavobacterium sp.]
LPEGESFGKVRFVTEQEINGDSSVKVAYNYFHYTDPPEAVHASNIISDEGIIATFPDAQFLELSKIDGFDTKILVHKNGGQIPVTTEVYDLPSLAQVHVFDGYINRISLENSGEKYYSIDALTATLNLFNADYSSWKEILLPVPNGNSIEKIHSISETKLVADSLVEVAYTYITSLSSADTTYESAIANEIGNVYLIIPEAREVVISEIEGAENKLIAKLGYDSAESGPMVLGSKVFGIDNTMATAEFVADEIILYPNPAASVINISHTNGIAKAEIYTMTGTLAKQFNDKFSSGMNVEDLADGFYILRLIDNSGGSSSHKVTIVH